MKKTLSWMGMLSVVLLMSAAQTARAEGTTDSNAPKLESKDSLKKDEGAAKQTDEKASKKKKDLRKIPRKRHL